jgi:hypothetical protein
MGSVVQVVRQVGEGAPVSCGRETRGQQSRQLLRPVDQLSSRVALGPVVHNAPDSYTFNEGWFFAIQSSTSR